MTVDHAAGPLKVSARILKPPMLLYGAGSKDARIVSNLILFAVHTAIDMYLADALQWIMEYVYDDQPHGWSHKLTGFLQDRQTVLQSSDDRTLARSHLRDAKAISRKCRPGHDYRVSSKLSESR